MEVKLETSISNNCQELTFLLYKMEPGKVYKNKENIVGEEEYIDKIAELLNSKIDKEIGKRLDAVEKMLNVILHQNKQIIKLLPVVVSKAGKKTWQTVEQLESFLKTDSNGNFKDYLYTRLREIAADGSDASDIGKPGLHRVMNYLFKSPEEASLFTAYRKIGPKKIFIEECSQLYEVIRGVMTENTTYTHSQFKKDLGIYFNNIVQATSVKKAEQAEKKRRRQAEKNSKGDFGSAITGNKELFNKYDNHDSNKDDNNVTKKGETNDSNEVPKQAEKMLAGKKIEEERRDVCVEKKTKFKKGEANKSHEVNIKEENYDQENIPGLQSVIRKESEACQKKKRVATEEHYNYNTKKRVALTENYNNTKANEEPLKHVIDPIILVPNEIDIKEENIDIDLIEDCQAPVASRHDHLDPLANYYLFGGYNSGY